MLAVYFDNIRDLTLGKRKVHSDSGVNTFYSERL